MTLKRGLSQYSLQRRTQVHSEYSLHEMIEHQFQTFFWIYSQIIGSQSIFWVLKEIMVDPTFKLGFVIGF